MKLDILTMTIQNHLLLIGIVLFITAPLTEQQFVNFSYTGSTGPANWGRLNPSYSACSTSKAQSPVNIVSKDVVYEKSLKPLDRDYPTSNGTMINAGFTVGLFYDHNIGVVNIDGKNFSLKQIHWHTPSEHTIDGVRYTAELHLVHTSSDGGIAVVSVLFKYGDPDPLVDQLKVHFQELAKDKRAGHEETHIPVVNIDTKHLKRGTRKYYRYVGSLTVPPCSENVTWTILGKVREISKEQVEILKAPLDDGCKSNSRPSQPLNGRKIKLYHELYDKNDE